MMGPIKRIALASAVCAALACVATTAKAQGAMEFSPRLYVGAGLGFNYLFNNSLSFGAHGAVSSDGSTLATQAGFGWNVAVGLRLSPWIGVELGWDGLYHPSAAEGSWNYAVIDGFRLTPKIHFPTGYNIEPYIRLSGGFYFYGDEFQVEQSGFGFDVGVGVTYMFNAVFEVDLLLLYRAWYFAGMEWNEELTCSDSRGYCPFGDEYMHSVNLAVEVRWNSWLFMW